MSQCRNRPSIRVSTARISLVVRGVRTSFLSDPWNKRESTRGMVEGFVVTSEIRVVSSLGDERGSKGFINGDLFVKISSNPSPSIPLSSACNARDTRTGEGDNGRRVMNQRNILKVVENIVVENIN